MECKTKIPATKDGKTARSERGFKNLSLKVSDPFGSQLQSSLQDATEKTGRKWKNIGKTAAVVGLIGIWASPLMIVKCVDFNKLPKNIQIFGGLFMFASIVSSIAAFRKLLGIAGVDLSSGESKDNSAHSSTRDEQSTSSQDMSNDGW